MKIYTFLLLSGFASACFSADQNIVKVFMLAGQSNMQGAGRIAMDPNRNGGKGSLEYLVKQGPDKERYAHLVDARGAWVTRDDVFISYLDRKGKLSVGFGARSSAIGPEMQFGHVLGDYYKEPVLLVKTAWGGKSLARDFRPPAAGGDVGSYYREMVALARELLSDPGAAFPELKGRKPELAGFAWHQGWNDGCNRDMCLEYEANLGHFIRDVRKEFGVPKLPFVIADSGFGGRNQKVDRRLMIRQAQAAPARSAEFKGTVFCVETQDFFRPAEESPSRQGYHWNSNAETYFLIGDGMGKAMLRLIKGS
ncbi:MAG: sialate O-acetylesterase [Verrucomicrobiota bacterium]